VHRTAVSVGLAAAALVIGGVLGSLGGFQPSVPDVSTPTTIPSGIEVHVAGWVVSPGVVTVGDGAIVADAVAAAGGLRAGARSDLINLAAKVGSGEQIVVPGPEAASGGARSDGLISLNRATASDLEALPGVGPVLAERIAAFRETNGPFGQVEALLQVPGIGEAKLASIRDLLRVP
jgi:competence protein ComEA